ncbi:hypothetical protein [Rhodococcus sp. NPDC057529]|uniref:hypothetical protein n=1 Tax=Rhodococcus sp. NPDC057529 TaxID=3346158 RepID=UPI00366DB2BD
MLVRTSGDVVQIFHTEQVVATPRAAPVGAVDEPRALPAAQDRLHTADSVPVSGAGRADRSRRGRGRR